ncbi:GYDIA family GHMP kinase [Lacinutrix chionoecetis]
MQTFYSHGKLLLTAEYVVLDGAKALALPTKFGQSLTVETINESKLIWQSFDYKGAVWFEEAYTLLNGNIVISRAPHNEISTKLLNILNSAKNLNANFLNDKNGYKVTSVLEFANNWGLGSSSTLLNNIAQWAKVDAFALSNATFGGSGYDIACAQNNQPIIYQLQNKQPIIARVLFNKDFEDQLFFVHLNRKQDSRASIKTYRDSQGNSDVAISKINDITSKILTSKSIKEFNSLVEEHETLIGKITNQKPIKERLFPDFKNEIKSLGGWNGDFVLATGVKHYVYSYFTDKGYNCIVDYKDMIF